MDLPVVNVGIKAVKLGKTLLERLISVVVLKVLGQIRYS